MTRAPLTVLTVASAILCLPAVRAQSPTYAACGEAAADANAPVTGAVMLAIPGIASDFILSAGGQIVERSNGTAHFSALVHRASEIDRQLLLELDLAGRILPGQPNHPPAGALPNELLSSAYVPLGPVDPAQFRYYTSGSGSLRGYGAYSGALISVQLSSPLQAGFGASNRNVLNGLACRLSLQVLVQPSFLVLAPSGDATLSASMFPSFVQCASH